jgi:ABC-2 type transport system permease protein
MFNRIITLIIKEFWAIWRDPQSRSVLIIPPIMQLLVYSYAATLEVKNVPIGIINEDNGIISRRIIQNFQGSDTFSDIYYLQNNQLKNFIDTQKGLVVVRFGEDFSRKVLNNQTSNLQVIIDGRKSNTALILSGYISEIINNYNLEYAGQNNKFSTKALITTRHWFNPNLEYRWFMVPALLALISLILGLVVTGLSIARERELGTFEQLLVSPIQPWEILIGKTVPGLFLGIAEATFLFLIIVFILKIPFTGSVILLYISLFVFLLSVLSVGLFISSMSKTQQQAILGTFIFMPPAMMLSGFATPIENMPMWLQNLTYINPLRYFLVIVRGLFLKDIPTEVVLANLLPLIVISVFAMTGSALFFRRRLE